MTPDEAKAFLEQEGVLLENARGKAESVSHTIAGGPIKGGWTKHPKGPEILAATRALREDENTLVCRIAKGKITFIHRRLWAAVVRLSDELDIENLSSIRENHTGTRTNQVDEVPFPDWVPEDVWDAAAELSKDQAREQIGKRF